MNDFKIEGKGAEAWGEIERENRFRKKLERTIKEVLYIGDGAYKITIDTQKSQYPILEWYPGERIELVHDRGRLKEVVFKTPYADLRQQYVLYEHYGYGYITNELYRGDEKVDIKCIEATKGISDWAFDASVILGIPIQIFESKKWEGRGGSIYDGKVDSFDALDEVWSQWLDALRAGRSKEYIPECLVPRNPDTGEAVKPNHFDNRYIMTGDDVREEGKNQIVLDQPDIPHDSYAGTYSTALDLCLQGIISPSTLGIDVKKLDNAEAQREKEKATLYMRNAIIEALQETLPEVVAACVNAYRLAHGEPVEEVRAGIPFGEYANPSFESQVETVGKGKMQGIMSIEASVEELYGDSKDEKWKAQEVKRLKIEQGIEIVDEPSVTGYDAATAGE